MRLAFPEGFSEPTTCSPEVAMNPDEAVMITTTTTATTTTTTNDNNNTNNNELFNLKRESTESMRAIIQLFILLIPITISINETSYHNKRYW